MFRKETYVINGKEITKNVMVDGEEYVIGDAKYLYEDNKLINSWAYDVDETIASFLDIYTEDKKEIALLDQVKEYVRNTLTEDDLKGAILDESCVLSYITYYDEEFCPGKSKESYDDVWNQLKQYAEESDDNEDREYYTRKMAAWLCWIITESYTFTHYDEYNWDGRFSDISSDWMSKDDIEEIEEYLNDHMWNDEENAAITEIEESRDYNDLQDILFDMYNNDKNATFRTVNGEIRYYIRADHRDGYGDMEEIYYTYWRFVAIKKGYGPYFVLDKERLYY